MRRARAAVGVGRMRKSFVLLVAACALVLSACDWAMVGGGSYVNGSNFEGKPNTGDVSALAESWQAPLALESSRPSKAVVAGNVVYVGDDDGTLSAFDATAPDGLCSGTPRVCTPLWTGTTAAPITTTPAVANGVAYVATGTTLYAFDATGTTNCGGTPKTCTPLWTASVLGPPGSPTVSGGRVYVYADSGVDGELEVFDASGVTNCVTTTPKTCSPLWTAGAPEPHLGDVAPAVAFNKVYLADGVYDATGQQGCSGTPRTCDALWQNFFFDNQCDYNQGYTVSGAAISDGRVVFSSTCSDDSFNRYGFVETFDASGVENCDTFGDLKLCNPLWISDGQEQGGSIPAIANGVVYEPFSLTWITPPFNTHSAAGFVGFDLADGSRIWNGVGGASTSQPSVAAGLVYTVGGGTLRVFDAGGTVGCSGSPTSCNPLQTINANGPDTSATIAWGNVYVHDYLGLHAYTTP
jgi:hypothetical protein